jgi:hypothetical protein
MQASGGLVGAEAQREAVGSRRRRKENEARYTEGLLARHAAGFTVSDETELQDLIFLTASAAFRLVLSVTETDGVGTLKRALVTLRGRCTNS